MSTRAIVAAKFADGRVGAVYVHFDGADHLPILEARYNTQEKAEALIMLGDQSSLGEPYGGEHYVWDTDGHTDNSTTFLKRFEEVWELDWDREYIYTWDGSVWKKFAVRDEED